MARPRRSRPPRCCECGSRISSMRPRTSRPRSACGPPIADDLRSVLRGIPAAAEEALQQIAALVLQAVLDRAPVTFRGGARAVLCRLHVAIERIAHHLLVLLLLLGDGLRHPALEP